MERGLDLSRQGLAALAQVPRDVVHHAERDGEPYALSLAQNRLVHLSDIHLFAHVVQLDLSGNQLQSLDGIDTLVRLESLNASRNNLMALDALVALTHLRVLSVAENKLTQIDALRSLKALVAVDASYNNIVKWPQLSQLPKLESIDLSSNHLNAFPVGVAVRLFPPSLRRLSLAKNQIEELCGVAALGMFLQNLQMIKVDNNPATQRVLRDGGCLDFLWVNLFANVGFTKGAGMHRDDFVVPVEVVEAVEDALERGDEAVLMQFLLTGAAPPRGAPPGVYRPQGFSPQWDAPTQESQHSNTTTSKLNEASRPGYIDPSAQPASALSSDGLSKESKMEMWKRIMDERKAQEQRDKIPEREKAATPVTEIAPLPTPPPAPTASLLTLKDSIISKPVPKTRTTESPASSSPVIVPRRDPLVSSLSVSPQSVDTLATQIKAVNEQVAGMRKYMNVWIKREQLTRDAAAKRIQRFTHHRRWLRCIEELVSRSRARRRLEYGVVHCSSARIQPVPMSQRHLHIYAAVIQRHVRGWLSRFRVSRWMYYSGAAVKIQHMWRRRRGVWIAVKRELGLLTKPSEASSSLALVNAVTALAQDVRQLQRVFVVQERALAHQWRELAHYKQVLVHVWTPAIVKIQSRWRGHAVRCKSSIACQTLYRRTATKTDTCSRNAEIAALRAELDALKQVVRQLVERK